MAIIMPLVLISLELHAPQCLLLAIQGFAFLSPLPQPSSLVHPHQATAMIAANVN